MSSRERWAEQATGKSWEELINRELFGPLKIRTAGFGAPNGKHPWGHLDPANGGGPVPPGPMSDNPPALAPAGTVHMSLADWGRFASLHLTGTISKKKYLSPETLETLHTPIGDSKYSLGWIVTKHEWGGDHVLAHDGTNTMWYARVVLSRQRNAAILVTVNQGGQAKACDDVVEALLDVVRTRREAEK